MTASIRVTVVKWIWVQIRGYEPAALEPHGGFLPTSSGCFGFDKRLNEYEYGPQSSMDVETPQAHYKSKMLKVLHKTREQSFDQCCDLQVCLTRSCTLLII